MKKVKDAEIIECKPSANGVYVPISEGPKPHPPDKVKKKSIANKLEPYNFRVSCAPFGNISLRVNIDRRLVPIIVGLGSLIVLGGVFTDGIYRIRDTRNR